MNTKIFIFYAFVLQIEDACLQEEYPMVSAVNPKSEVEVFSDSLAKKLSRRRSNTAKSESTTAETPAPESPSFPKWSDGEPHAGQQRAVIYLGQRQKRPSRQKANKRNNNGIFAQSGVNNNLVPTNRSSVPAQRKNNNRNNQRRRQQNRLGIVFGNRRINNRQRVQVLRPAARRRNNRRKNNNNNRKNNKKKVGVFGAGQQKLSKSGKVPVVAHPEPMDPTFSFNVPNRGQNIPSSITNPPPPMVPENANPVPTTTIWPPPVVMPEQQETTTSTQPPPPPPLQSEFDEETTTARQILAY